MKSKTLLIPIIAIALAGCRGNEGATTFQTYPNIADSAIHSVEEIDYDVQSRVGCSSDNSGDNAPLVVERRMIIDTAAELYGVSEDWTKWLIGTTWNEDYHEDRFLEFAWACEIVNEYRDWSVYELDGIWGDFYSIENANAGYYAADNKCLEMVYEAITDPDERICEVDGMIDWYVEGYYLIYDSSIYNCQVWGNE